MMLTEINNPKQAIGAAKDGAVAAMDTAKNETASAVSGVRDALLDAMKTVTGIVATVRAAGFDRALARFGLARKRSPLSYFGAFGAGLAIGAGIALLAAPSSGAELRRNVAAQIRRASGKAKTVAHQLEERVRPSRKAAASEERAETISSQAQQAAAAASQGEQPGRDNGGRQTPARG